MLPVCKSGLFGLCRAVNVRISRVFTLPRGLYYSETYAPNFDPFCHYHPNRICQSKTTAMGLFATFRRRQPPMVPTDRIIPLRFWDDLSHLRSLVHNFTLRFDDVLDIPKLRAALERLMDIGDWGQLGARLRLNV